MIFYIPISLTDLPENIYYIINYLHICFNNLLSLSSEITSETNTETVVRNRIYFRNIFNNNEFNSEIYNYIYILLRLIITDNFINYIHLQFK